MSPVRISRPALTSRARRGLVDRSLVVVAPAGYGKTTLLEQALDGSGVRAAWVRCTPADRHAGKLVALIARAVNEAAPGLSEAVVTAGDTAHETPEPTDAVRALLAECHELLVDPITIVVDDAETLAGSEAAGSVVAELLAGTGPKVGVAVLSRHALPLRLAKLRAAGRLVELGTSDLVFDGAECGVLVAERSGRSPSTDEVDGLMTATEGWPLGIATLVESRDWDREQVDLRGSFRSPRALHEFLGEEVLAGQDGARRLALLSSAVPRRLTPAVAAALGLPADHLVDAGTRGLFLRRVEPGREVYAYHPLFREVLLDHLEAEVTPDEIRDLHRRVAPAVADHDPIEAIEHWLAAEEWASAVDALSGEARAVAPTSPTLVRSWLDRLPEEMSSDPSVQLLAGHLARADGEYDTAIARLGAGLGIPDGSAAGTADMRIDQRIDPTDEWWGRFVLVDCLAMVGRPEEGVAIVDGFDEPTAQAAGPVAAAAGLYAAHGLAAAGRGAAALDLAARVDGLPDAAAVAPLDALMRAYIDIPAGNLAETADRTLAAYREIEADDPLGIRFDLMAAHAIALAEQGRRDEAFDWWERQRVEAERALLVARSNAIRGVQALLLAQSGRMPEAEDSLALHQATGTWADQSTHVASALVAAWRGDRPATLASVQRALAAARAAPPLFRWWTSADVVSALVSVGALEQADAVLDDAASLVDEVYDGAAGRHLRARTMVLGALPAAGRADFDRAADLVNSGLEHADATAPEILRREWPWIEPVVSDALERGVLAPERTIGHLWTAFPDGSALVEMAEHPVAAVRVSAFRPALTSGHPTARSVVAGAVDDADPEVADAARKAVARAAVAPPSRRFETLGSFRVHRGGWTTDERSWGRPADARLVRFLLVHGETPVPTDLIYEALWPDLDADGARRSLQVSASRVRRLLDDPGPSPSVIEAGHGTYRLRLADDDVIDWQQFERAAGLALDADAPSIPLLERARALWGGEPLPEERYSDWAASWRARLVDRCVEVLVALVDAHNGAGQLASATRVARELVDLDPYDERSHRLLMTALARTGRRGQALRQYLVCRRMLLDHLGVEPGEDTSALYAHVLAGDVI